MDVVDSIIWYMITSALAQEEPVGAKNASRGEGKRKRLKKRVKNG